MENTLSAVGCHWHRCICSWSCLQIKAWVWTYYILSWFCSCSFLPGFEGLSTGMYGSPWASIHKLWMKWKWVMKQFLLREPFLMFSELVTKVDSSWIYISQPKKRIGIDFLGKDKFLRTNQTQKWSRALRKQGWNWPLCCDNCRSTLFHKELSQTCLKYTLVLVLFDNQ